MQGLSCPAIPLTVPGAVSRGIWKAQLMDRHRLWWVCGISIPNPQWSAAAASIAVRRKSFVYRIMSLVSSLLWNVGVCGYVCVSMPWSVLCIDFFLFNYDKYSLRSCFPRWFVLMTSCVGLHCLPNGGKMGAVTSAPYSGLGALNWPKSLDMTLYLPWSRTDTFCDDASPLCAAKVPLQTILTKSLLRESMPACIESHKVNVLDFE